MLVFVNDRAVHLPAGGTARDAVALFDADLALRLEQGSAEPDRPTARPPDRPSAYLTDGRGIRLPSDAPLHEGAILRVIVSARGGSNEADAHP